ncbi:hypothetical protein [Maridesulfovibrio salexigens]|uniref:Uncharacterized protein n=1 Tax=Maridesulfovibrio salexigens (strain ATCC 14822 / DSM 2638 / NCIMB 8403 / VKM B-1763) TaxID=526222 RepID=C6C1S4_MARSD|nr:hypothetical protein [Maridesulfovibrio salexigens]ACS79320.1 hypothetical protein Desal_1257 [Maridesulfovibrio salexigens DSM 2638]
MARKFSLVLILLVTLLCGSWVEAAELYIMPPAIGKVRNKEKDRHKTELSIILKDKQFKKSLRKGILGFLKRAVAKNEGINIKRAGFGDKFDPESILIPLLFVDNVISFVDEYGSAEQRLYKGRVYIGLNFLLFQAKSESLVYSAPMLISVPYLDKTKNFSLEPLAGQIRSSIVEFFTDRKRLKADAQDELGKCLANMYYLFSTKTCSVDDITLSKGTLKRIQNPAKYKSLAQMLASQALSQEIMVLPPKSRFNAIRRGLHASVSMFGVSFQQGSEKSGFSERDNVYQTSMRMPKPETKYSLTIKTGSKDNDLGAFIERNYTTAAYLQGNGDVIKCIKAVDATIAKGHTSVSDVNYYNSLINTLSDLDSCKR